MCLASWNKDEVKRFGHCWSLRDHDSFRRHPPSVVIMVDGGCLHLINIASSFFSLFSSFAKSLYSLWWTVRVPFLSSLLISLLFFTTLSPLDEQQPYSKVNLFLAAWLRVVSILFLLSLSVNHVFHPFPLRPIPLLSYSHAFILPSFPLALPSNHRLVFVW